MAKKGKKEIEAYIKLQIPAGAANPSPPVGPALGQHGVIYKNFVNLLMVKQRSLRRALKCL